MRLVVLRASRWCGAIALAALLASPRAARAEPAEACIQAYEEAQELRRAGRLLRARDALVTCAQAGCPAVTTQDCAGWLREVEASLPTVTLGARTADGGDAGDAGVWLDGVEASGALDGRAIALDPGRHQLRFARPGAAIEREVVVREGEKDRPVTVVFPAPPALAAPAQPPGAPRWALPLGVAGVIALGAGVYLDVRGVGDAEDLRACTPRCSRETTDAARRELLAGDVAIALGVTTVVIATWLLVRGGAGHADVGARAVTIRF